MWSIIQGLCQHFRSLKLLRIIFCNKTHLSKWSSVVVKNFALVIVAKEVFRRSLQWLSTNFWIECLLTLLFYLMYAPLFLYCYIITIDTIGYIVEADQRANASTLAKHFTLSQKLYLGLLSGVVYVFPYGCQFIPYVDTVLVPIFTSLVNSFYYFYFSNIRTSPSAMHMFYAFEQHVGFFIGYGIPEFVCQLYLPWEVFYMINFLMLPLNILNIEHNQALSVSLTSDTSSPKKILYVSTIFVLPLILTNMILETILFVVSLVYHDTSMLVEADPRKATIEHSSSSNKKKA